MQLARPPRQFGVHVRHKLLRQGGDLWGKCLLLVPWPGRQADRAAGVHRLVACSNDAGNSTFMRVLLKEHAESVARRRSFL